MRFKIFLKLKAFGPMLHSIGTAIFMVLPFFCFSQARLVINNNPYIVLNGGTAGTPVYIVLDNPAANAITLTTAQVNGGIKSESEFNMVKWNIGIATGAYSIPFTKTFGGPSIPFTANITTAGSAGGNIKFSTYPGSNWDNATYMPTGVTNMSSIYSGGVNNSEYVIDRFWIIDANGYATKPTASLSFTYIDAEYTPVGNSITEANLGAQRWSGANWDAYTPQGTWADAGTKGTVSNAPAPPADFFRVWTLSDIFSPLPVELISFTGNCDNKNALLKWATASETNNDFFTVERSPDGSNFTPLSIINGAGNSSTLLNYSFEDINSFASGAYYRIRQTDYNGESQTSAIVFVQGCSGLNSDMDIYSSGGNEFTFFIHSIAAENYNIRIFNSMGQIVKAQTIYINEGTSRLNFMLDDLRDAIYFVSIDNGKDKSITKKIIVN